MMLADAELLRRYAEDRSEAAFTELVQRHAGVIYAAALRQTGGDTMLAEDVGQRVFVQLARKAPALTCHPALLGWLHRAARFAAIDAVRARQRRQAREQEAEIMNGSSDPGGRVEWEKLQPLIDAALEALNETDRAAVLLRFFEGRSYADVGAHLDLAENTARMRVERALEKLRRALASRGCTSTGAALATVLTGQALAKTAPAGWAATVTAAALAGAGPGTGAAVAGASIFAMNKLTIAVLTGIAVAGLTTAGWHWKTRWTRQENAVLRAENTELRRLKAARAAVADGEGPALGDVADREKLAKLSALVQEHHAASKAAAMQAPAKMGRTMQNRGIGAPREAIETFAWACLAGDTQALARQIYFEGDARARAEARLAQLPEGFRRQFRTPEELYGFFVAADALVAPPPADADLLDKIDVIFLKSDRIEMRPKGASRGRQQYQWTADGWKLVFTAEAVDGLAANVMRNNPLPGGEGSAP